MCSLVLAYSPCSPGQQIDRLPGGQYPHPYSIPCQPTANFRNETKLVNFPHTDVLQVILIFEFFYFQNKFNYFLFNLLFLKYCFRCNAYGELKCGGTVFNFILSKINFLNKILKNIRLFKW